MEADTFFSKGKCTCCDKYTELYLLSCLDKICKQCLDDAHANENKCFCGQIVTHARKLVDCPESPTRAIFTIFEMLDKKARVTCNSPSGLISSKYVKLYENIITKSWQLYKFIETVNESVTEHNKLFPSFESNIVYCDSANLRDMLNYLYEIDKRASDAEKWCAKMIFALNAVKMMIMYEIHTQKYEDGEFIKHFMNIPYIKPHLLTSKCQIVIDKNYMSEFDKAPEVVKKHLDTLSKHSHSISHNLYKGFTNFARIIVEKYDMFEDDSVFVVRVRIPKDNKMFEQYIMFHYKKFVSIGEDIQKLIDNESECIFNSKNNSIANISFINKKYIYAHVSDNNLDIPILHKIDKITREIYYITDVERKRLGIYFEP